MSDGASNWQRSDDAEGICWLTLARPDASANSLSRGVMAELDGHLRELEQQTPTAVVFQSGKVSGFILGADISEFQALQSQKEALQLVREGQAIINRIEALSCPTVAFINGYALGGGLELAMACNYRIAVESHKGTLGLPEVQLGVHPGFGGTVRSIALVGAPQALDLMLTGRSISSIKAKKIGLIDRLTTPDGGPDTVREVIRERPPLARAPWHMALLCLPVIRGLLANAVEKKVPYACRLRRWRVRF